MIQYDCSPYSDMALLPILAFFFCSAGPFLFLIFFLRNMYTKIRNKLFSTKEENLEIERSAFTIVKTDDT